MNLYQLRYFAQLAHDRHYTRTAEKLGITQPSLSNAITQLEKELGVQLFAREGKKIFLTSFGEMFLDTVESTLATLDKGIEELEYSARGDGLVRIGLLRTLGTVFLPDVLSGFREAYPDRNVEFTVASATGISRDLIDMLDSERFDIVFASKPVHDANFDIVKVFSQKLVLVTPSDHPLADCERIDLRDAAEYPFVHFSPGSGLRNVIDNLFDKINAKPNVIMETEEDQLVAGLVASGFGISIVPDMECLDYMDVKTIEIEYPTWERYFYMITKKNKYLSPAITLFRNYVMNNCGFDL